MHGLRSPRTWGWLGAGSAFGLLAWWFFTVAAIATPRAIARLMAEVTDPDTESEIYDPCCGSGRLLFAAHQHAHRRANPDSSEQTRTTDGRRLGPRLYGQELSRLPLVLARLNAAVRGMDAKFARGDSMRRPAFLAPDHSLKKVDVVLGNPMWNQSFHASVYEDDQHARFPFGVPPASDGDWGWIQHMHAALSDRGRMATILDVEMAARASDGRGDPAEMAIKREFVRNDLIEAVLACGWPAGIPRRTLRGAVHSRGLPTGVMLVINKRKRHPGQVFMVEGSRLLVDYCAGRVEGDDAISMVVDAFWRWEPVEGVSAVVSTESLADHRFDLSPARYVAQSGPQIVR